MIAQPGWWPALPGLIAELAGCTPAAACDLLGEGGVCLDYARATGSSLNSDGTPVEIAVSVTREGRRVRVLMDPAHWETDPVRRCRAARAACERLSRGLPYPVRAGLLEGIEQAWPDEAALREWLPSGCLWLGAVPGGSGLAAYLSARWGPPAGRWPRIFAWLDGLGVAPGDCLAAASRWGEPASVSLAAGRALRARVYFRLAAPLRLGELALPGIEESAMAGFLAAVIGERPIRRAGLLISVSAGVGAGPPDGCKVDVCAHCASRSPWQWAAVIERLAAELGLPSPGIAHVLLDERAEMAFIGLACRQPGERQLNCYLKAPGERRALGPAHA